MATDIKRKLTTILCADVKSYGHPAPADERATFTRFREYRDAMSLLIRHHGGRIVNTWGDALTAEFPSVVDAVQSAIEIQQDHAQRNQALAEADRMWFRIGISLGDVMVEGEDLYGEGVTIAARLQETARPGGIAISRTVYDQVGRRMTVEFSPARSVEVRDIAQPVETWRVELDASFASVEDPDELPTRILRLMRAVDSHVQKIARSREFRSLRAWWGRQANWLRILIAVVGLLILSNLLLALVPFLVTVIVILGIVYLWPFLVDSKQSGSSMTQDSSDERAA